MRYLFLLVFVLSLVSCKLSPSAPADNYSTLSSGRGNEISACVVEANMSYREARRAERIRFREAIVDCGGDSLCISVETQINKSILEETRADHIASILNCQHQQGEGAGGQ